MLMADPIFAKAQGGKVARAISEKEPKTGGLEEVVV